MALKILLKLSCVLKKSEVCKKNLEKYPVEFIKISSHHQLLSGVGWKCRGFF